MSLQEIKMRMEQWCYLANRSRANAERRLAAPVQTVYAKMNGL